MSILMNAVDKVIKKENSVTYTLGRFKIVRDIYSRYCGLRQSIGSTKHNVHQEFTIFPDVSVDFATKDIQDNAVFLGLQLPSDITRKIQEFAKSSLFTREDGLRNFYYHEVKNGYLPDERPIPQAIAVNPLECNAIKQIINDPVLLQIVAKYLGYYPNHAHPILRWSFVLEIPDEVRIKNHQTVNYHYDIYGFNFIYANFYILKTDRYSGAHAMIKKSHNRKSWQMLFNSANQTDDVLHDYYGQENELIIEAEEGFGFVQDASCYHKALRPVNQERLMLQIRFT